MTYKIAVASSNGITVDGAFGEVTEFRIYQVEGEQYTQVEDRKMPEPFIQKPEDTAVAQRADSTDQQNCGGQDSDPTEAGCCGGQDSEHTEAGCCGGHGGHGGCGCGTPDGSSIRIEALSDCRSIVCKKIGPHAKKLLERKAIAAFDVDCSVEDALKKIIFYYNRMDRHKK